MIRKSILTVLFSTLLLACGGGPDIDAKLDAIESEWTAQTQVFCDCYAEIGFPSREMCVAASPLPSPQARSCALDAFEVDADASAAYLDCLVQAEKDYTTCAANDLVCADLASADGCGNTFNTTVSACPELPANVDAALSACAPQQ